MENTQKKTGEPLNETVVMLLRQMVQLQTQQTESTALKPTTVNNNNNYNIQMDKLEPITDEVMTEHIDQLSIEFIMQGAKGYAKFGNMYPFKDHIICTDKARRRFKFKNAEGEIIDDLRGGKLAQKFFLAINPRNNELIDSEYSILQKQVQEIAASGNVANSNLVELLNKSSTLQEIRQFCSEAAEGKENKFIRDFVSYLD